MNSQNNNITLGEPDEFTLDKDDEYIQKNTTWADSAETGDDAILGTFPEQPKIKNENPMHRRGRGPKRTTNMPFKSPRNPRNRGGKSTRKTRKNKSKRGNIKEAKNAS